VRNAALTFPHGELKVGEAPGDAARRIVAEWTSTKAPKLELVDVTSAPDGLTLVMRAMLVEEPQGVAQRSKRMALPENVGALTGKYVEEALKTSLNYKLTRG
jgi:ADP-ribose pyrophosphatase YjhB (NUDIX family)